MIGRLMSSFLKDDNTAKLGDGTAMAHLGAEAFGKGCVVEAAYWMVMADLHGFPNLEGVLNDYAAAWVKMGCPEQRETVGGCFSEGQREFGFAALKWLSKSDEAYARNWFSQEAKEGNNDARDFMRKHVEGRANP